MEPAKNFSNQKMAGIVSVMLLALLLPLLAQLAISEDVSQAVTIIVDAREELCYFQNVPEGGELDVDFEVSE